MLFRTFERHLVSRRLDKGFDDVDDFVSFSLSVQNRRKSRAGHAFENHLEQLFINHDVKYKRNAITENKSKPDFLFPSQQAYHDTEFPNYLLTMLGVKTSCKDRWRQVLPEADRISNKHLTTLEPGISTYQTDEMLNQNVQLVIPLKIQETYLESQRTNIISLCEFLELLKEKQKSY